MGWLASIAALVQMVTLAGAGLLLFRLFRLGLLGTYRWFAAYLFVDVATSCLSLGLPRNRNLIAYLWLVTELLTSGLFVLVVLELYRLVLVHYKGIQTFARSFLAVGMTVSMLLAAVITYLNHPGARDRFPAIAMVLAVSNTVSIGLTIFLVLAVVFVSYFPVSVPRNAALHLMVFGVFFLGRALPAMLRLQGGVQVTQTANIALFGVVALCYLVWITGLTKEGEERKVAVSHTFHRQDEERLVAQLDAINRVLLRTARNSEDG